MFVRDSLTASMALQQQTGPTWLGAIGDPESDFNAMPDPLDGNGQPTPWTLAIRAVHAVSYPMGQLRQKIEGELNQLADASQDFSDDQINMVMNDIAQMTSYAQQLPALIAAAKSLPEYQTDLATAGELHNWLAFTLDWLGSTAAAIPQLILNLPSSIAQYASGQVQAMIDAMLAALKKAEGAGLSLLAPLAIGAVAIFALVLTGIRKSETTRTYRKYVA